jgi:protein-L-isoaspartate(D-aspartate) O-methyltransferase
LDEFSYLQGMGVQSKSAGELVDARQRMVEQQLMGRGIHDARVLEACRRVPRHVFVPPEHRSEAYEDYPLPIGEEQTISQPYIVALMLQEMRLKGGERVLEVGTGSGYQTALLAELGCKIHTIERLSSLLERARSVLESLGYAGIHYRMGDGTLGWPEESPFDRITVGAGAPQAPPSLLAQVDEDGRLIMPVGGAWGQELTLYDKRGGKIVERFISSCVFVKLIGKEGW